MIARRQFAKLLPFGLLTGCERIPQKQLGGTVRGQFAEGDAETKGLIVGSLGHPRERFQYFPAQVMYIRRLRAPESEAGVTFSSTMDDFPPNYSDPKLQAEIFALLVPEGQYEIFNFQVHGGLLDPCEPPTRTGRERINPREDCSLEARRPISILFRVQAWQITYVGEYLAWLADKSWWGPEALRFNLRYEVGDARDRDLAYARRHWPDYETAPVNLEMPDLAKMRHPSFAPPRPRV